MEYQNRQSICSYCGRHIGPIRYTRSGRPGWRETSDNDYELLIANAGPNNATNVIIQDSLPTTRLLSLLRHY
ncbi:MAG: hypothetical protein IPG76_23075 [Acidobacteria bacterium]|nr:hypothetical protein [Acidobacteriota bacterium]